MRTSFYLFLLIFLPFTTFAQSELNFGLSAALNYSNVSIGDVPFFETTSRTGISIGIVPEVVLSDRIKFPLNLMYSVKGHNEESNGELLRSLTYHYVEFMPEFDARIIGPIRAGLGMKVGYKVVDLEWIPGQTSNPVNLRDPFDLGVTGNLKFLFSRWELFCRYDLGIIGVNEVIFTDENGNQVGQTDEFNRNVQLGVALKL